MNSNKCLTYSALSALRCSYGSQIRYASAATTIPSGVTIVTTVVADTGKHTNKKINAQWVGLTFKLQQFFDRPDTGSEPRLHCKVFKTLPRRAP